MFTAELTEMVSHLSPEEKTELIRMLSAPERRVAPEERFRQMVSVMEEVTGFPIDFATRERPHTYIRAILAHAMTEEGYQQTLVCNLMGKDHATIYRMRCMVDTMMAQPRQWRQECAWIRKFNERLKAYDTDNGTDEGTLAI